MVCNNQTGYDTLASLRHCLSSVNHEAKELIAQSNSLGGVECHDHAIKRACKVLVDIKDNRHKYDQCSDNLNEMKVVAQLCPLTSMELNKTIVIMANLTCGQ